MLVSADKWLLARVGPPHRPHRCLTRKARRCLTSLWSARGSHLRRGNRPTPASTLQFDASVASTQASGRILRGRVGHIAPEVKTAQAGQVRKGLIPGTRQPPSQKDPLRGLARLESSPGESRCPKPLVGNVLGTRPGQLPSGVLDGLPPNLGVLLEILQHSTALTRTPLSVLHRAGFPGAWQPSGRRPGRFPAACPAGCGGWGR